jgi:hypothetical protein
MKILAGTARSMGVDVEGYEVGAKPKAKVS